MKKSLHICFVLFLISVCALAQNEGKTIIEELNSSKWGQGKVTVMQDEAIQGLMAVRQETDTTRRLGVLEPSTSYKKVRGYRIQVYSGNNQQRSKHEAESRQAQVRNAFPELDADVNFKSPFWRLRVGHFQRQEEAEEVLREMKKTLPGLSKEMYVVPDEIKLPVQ
ncbi:MAG: SPOR domain-containing protein [Dysgonomonas sp.]